MAFLRLSLEGWEQDSYEAGDWLSLLVLQHLAVVVSFLLPLASHPDTVKGCSGFWSPKQKNRTCLWNLLVQSA